MSQSNEGRKALTLGEDLNINQRVKFSGGNVVATGAGEEGFGFMTESGSSGEVRNVRLDNHTVVALASGSVSQGDNLYGAASGALATTISGRRQAIAMEAATDGQEMEVMPVGVNS